MISAAVLCAHLAGGFSCIPMRDAISCAHAETLVHQSVVVETECELIKMAPGSIYAPAESPLPVVRP